MAYGGSMRSVARMVEATSKKNEEIGNKKNAERSGERFECAADAYSKVFVVCGVIMALITAVFVVLLFRDAKDAGMGVFFFAIATGLIFFGAWATAHHRLIVEGNDVTYVNMLGFKKQFHFSELTQCLTTEQSIYLYAGNKKMAYLSKDVYGVKLLMERCKRDGVEVRGKARGRITKLSLVWGSTRTLALIFVWAAVGISVFMIPVRVSSVGFSLSDIPFLLEMDLLIFGFFGFFVLMFMLFFAFGLKEIKSIEKALGISFTEEMARRGAEGREYQDEEWFVEAAPGKIEVLNRRFIKAWGGVKMGTPQGSNMYYIEFTDINGEVRKIGGTVQKSYAEKMDDWYYKR